MGAPSAEAWLRVATALPAPRKESPPDRFLRAPGFEAVSVALDPGRASVSPGSVGRQFDDRHRELPPSRGRDRFGTLSVAFQAVAAAQEARARGAKRSTDSRIDGRGPTSSSASPTVRRSRPSRTSSTDSRIDGRGPTSSSSSPTVRRSRPARTSSTDSLRRLWLSSSMPSSRASSLGTEPSMHGALCLEPRSAARETGNTQKQVSVLFLSRAKRKVEDLDAGGSSPALEGTQEVAVARQWGLALVVFQWSFVLLFVMDRIFCLQNHLPVWPQ